jgi:hypothetical protein
MLPASEPFNCVHHHDAVMPFCCPDGYAGVMCGMGQTWQAQGGCELSGMRHFCSWWWRLPTWSFWWQLQLCWDLDHSSTGALVSWLAAGTVCRLAGLCTVSWNDVR